MIKDKIDKIIEEYKTIKMEKIPNSDFLKIENFKCYLNNNTIVCREKITKGDSDGSASVVLPLTADNKVVVCVEPRVFTDSTVSVDVPAGYMEKGETGEEAAKRELMEETGYTSEELKYLGKFYQDHGTASACNCFLIPNKIALSYNV